MLKVLAAVLAVLSAVISITIYSTTLPDLQKQVEDNASKIEQLSGAESSIKDIYFVISGNYTSGAPTFYSTELHYYVDNNINNLEELKEFLTDNTVFLAYYVTSVNDEKVINYRQSVAAGGGTYTTYSLQSTYLTYPLKYFSDDTLMVGNTNKDISGITFYGI